MSADTLVIGLGSIGVRHARILKELGRGVATVSRRKAGDFEYIGDALARGGITYAVIATETSQHEKALGELAAAKYRGKVLVEKPLFASAAKIPANQFESVFVGYNLRFHPVLKRARELLGDEPALQATFYVGQHLPDWRPGRDHRETASAKKALGGGAIRDLSHELDYAMWLLGAWQDVSAISLNSGSLGIETDDAASILLRCRRCPAVTLTLNYHHRPAARTFMINTAKRSLVGDLINGALTDNGSVEAAKAERDDTYRAMHEAILKGMAGACTLEEGVRTVTLIDAIERAARERSWVSA